MSLQFYTIPKTLEIFWPPSVENINVNLNYDSSKTNEAEQYSPRLIQFCFCTVTTLQWEHNVSENHDCK